jgi:hypothetical protein
VSDLPSDTLDYQAVVAEYFLALRGAGLLLSPLDQDLVAEWERRGLPVPIVCRGLRRGVERLAEERPPRPVRSVRALRFAVEDEWRAYQSGRVGDAPAPPPAEEEAARARLARARALLEDAGRTPDPARREGYRAACRALAAEAAHPGTPLERAEAAIVAADRHVLSAWLRSLPRAERAGLGRRVRLLAGARPRGTRPGVHREALRAHLLDLARSAGLTCLRGSV